MPPKIAPIKSSEVLSRAAAFLPQLAASNRAILQKRPDDVNIEILNGQEDRVIEMKLGLGVFEEKSSERDSNSSDSEAELEEVKNSRRDNRNTEKKKRIIVLPSELRAAASASTERNEIVDPFERVINSLLLFDSVSDSESESESDSELNVLEFE